MDVDGGGVWSGPKDLYPRGYLFNNVSNGQVVSGMIVKIRYATVN